MISMFIRDFSDRFIIAAIMSAIAQHRFKQMLITRHNEGVATEFICRKHEQILHGMVFQARCRGDCPSNTVVYTFVIEIYISINKPITHHHKRLYNNKPRVFRHRERLRRDRQATSLRLWYNT